MRRINKQQWSQNNWKNLHKNTLKIKDMEKCLIIIYQIYHSKTENKKIASHIPPLFFQAICAAITCLPVGHPHQSRSLNADMFYSSVQPLYLRNVPTSSINIYWIIIYRGTFCNQGNLRVQRWIRNHLLSRNLKLSCYLVAKLCLILFQPHRL